MSEFTNNHGRWIDKGQIATYDRRLEDTMSDVDVLERTTWHEAGHATVGLILFPDQMLYASIAEDEGFLGSVGLNTDWDEVMRGPIDRFLDFNAVLLAGRAAEERRYGSYGKAGLRNDENDAYEAFYAFWRYHRDLTIDEAEVAGQALARAHEIIERERPLFELIVVALLKRVTIDREHLLIFRRDFASTP